MSQDAGLSFDCGSSLPFNSYDPNIEPAKGDILFVDEGGLVSPTETYFRLLYPLPAVNEPSDLAFSKHINDGGRDSVLLEHEVLHEAGMPTEYPFADFEVQHNGRHVATLGRRFPRVRIVAYKNVYSLNSSTY